MTRWSCLRDRCHPSPSTQWLDSSAAFPSAQLCVAPYHNQTCTTNLCTFQKGGRGSDRLMGLIARLLRPSGGIGHQNLLLLGAVGKGAVAARGGTARGRPREVWAYHLLRAAWAMTITGHDCRGGVLVQTVAPHLGVELLGLGGHAGPSAENPTTGSTNQ